MRSQTISNLIRSLRTRLRREQAVRIAFYASLIFKAIFAGIEVLGGVIVAFISQSVVLDLVRLVTQEELAEDPRDLVANYLLHGAQHLSINAQHFAAVYLLIHGIIKLWLIIGLLRRKLWYYPTALIIFCLFIIYQIYLLSLHFSPWLLLITLVDAVVIALTWHEYRYLRSSNVGKSPF